MDKVIVEIAESYNIPVLGVEKLHVDFSYIPRYQTLGISTVDNVDTIIGQTSLVLVINGKEGHYGVKKSANSLMPFLNEEENSR